MKQQRAGAAAGQSEGGGGAAAPTLGKRTRVQGIDGGGGGDGAVQRKAAGDATAGAGAAAADDPRSVATAGVASASEAMPFRDRIQASFGRHDISHVRAQTGGAAADASRGLSASAYAIGDRVGFSRSPDLHTAAHEAAHVVQQQGGVQLAGGMDGGAGDPHEQHADAVADKVVRGESAEALLDQMRPSGGAAAGQVQRKADIPSGMVNARRYLSFNASAARNAITDHLIQQRLPQPHPRLAWRYEKAFYEQLFRGFNTFDISFEHPFEFAQALFPGDPFSLIDQMRPIAKATEAAKPDDPMAGGPVGPWQWSPAIGTAIAQLVEQAVISSLYRLGPRWLALADQAGASAYGSLSIDPDAIARAHPMDRFVAPAMCRPNVFEVHSDPAGGKKPATAPPPSRVGVRSNIQISWVASRQLWNWVRATPADSTAEEVSAALFDYAAAEDHEKRGDYYAAFLTAAPPLFGVPPQWAKRFKANEGYRPDKLPAADSDPDHQITALGASRDSDEIALIEIGRGAGAGAGGGSKDKGARAKTTAAQPPPDHDGAVADVTAQARFLKSKLAAWNLGDAADQTLAFLARRAADGTDGATWVPVLAAQRETLTTIAAGIRQLDEAIEQVKVKRTGQEARPLREIMRFYADATATSHLKETAKRLILRAANAQAALTLQGLQSSVRDMDMSADMMRGSVKQGDYDRTQASNRISGIDADAIDLQTRIMRGSKVEAEDIEDLQIRVEDAALDAKLIATESALHELEQSADEAGAGLAAWFASRFSSSFRDLKDATGQIQIQISDIRHDWNSAKTNADMPDDNGMDIHRKRLRQAVQDAKRAFAALSQRVDISGFLREGADLVKWQQVRTACVKIAALIGVSLVGGFVGGMIARGVAGLMLGTGGAAAVEGLSTGGMLVARGLGMVTETAITSAGQTAIFGDHFGTAFLENMIMNLGTAGVMKLIGDSAAEALRVEKAVGGLWSKAAYGGKVVLAESAAISGHLIMGVAMSYVAHRVVTGERQPPPETLQDWLMQGASIAVGRYVGHGLAAHREARARLARTGIDGGARLVGDAEKLAALAKRAEDHPKAGDAMELLAKRHALLSEELKVLEALEGSPAKLRAAKLSKADVTSAKAGVNAQLAEVRAQGFGDVALHSSGMHELIPGALWSGTERQVTELVAHARESGLDVHAAKDPQGGKWRVKIDGREIVVEERFERPSGESKPHDGHDSHAAPHAPERAAQSEQHTGAAQHVPDSSFVGTGAHRPDITLPSVQRHAESASLLLNNAVKAVKVDGAAGEPFFNPLHNGDISISIPGAPSVRVKFELMAAGEDVARHTYKHGDPVCTVYVSSKARDVDVARAVSHELAEIHAIALGTSTSTPAMRRGSTSEALDAHDIGRKAEIQVLLYQAERAPEGSHGDQGAELSALIKHLGFDPKTVGSDARAKRLLGEAEVVRIDEVLNKPRTLIPKGKYHANGEIVGQAWVFTVTAELPNGRKAEIASGSVRLEPSANEPGVLVPAAGKTLDFTVNNVIGLDHRQSRVKLEGAERITDYVMDQAITQFTEKFKTAPELGGMLAWDNKLRFQHAYAEVMLANPGMSPEAVADAAILKIPYGAARDRAKYDVKAHASGQTTILTGDPPRLVDVPDYVTAIAKPKKKNS